MYKENDVSHSLHDMKWTQSSCREGKILTCKPQQCRFQRLEMLSPKSWEPRESSCAFGGKGQISVCTVFCKQH